MNIYIKLFINLLIVFFLFSCGKEDLPEKEKDGESSALYNGKQWDMPAYGGMGRSVRKDTIIINMGNSPEARGQTLYFINILKKGGKQFLYPGFGGNGLPNVNYRTLGTSGDVPCDGYKMLVTDSTDNWIEITNEANDYAEIWGNFSVTLIRMSTCIGSPYPDTVRLRNGAFHIWNVKSD